MLILSKYLMVTKKNDSDKLVTDINEAYYQYAKGLIFVLTSEFATFGVLYKESTEPKIAEENAYLLLAVLENYLKSYSSTIVTH